jgi:hypothetical protein
MRLPTRISPAARARRALLIDAIAAIALAAIALNVASGLGVVFVFGIPVLLLGLLWLGIERRVARRTRSSRRRADPAVR